jgi:anti-sigma B factor antagonist
MALTSQEPLHIEDLDGNQPGHRILRLRGPVVLGTLFHFQSTLRSREDRVLIIDFTGVPYVDSAGIGALVGAYVSHNKDGRSLALVGVSERVRQTMGVTRVEQFFRFFNSIPEAQKAST